MKHMDSLLILAAGKSSRFGGFPKAFCKVADEYVVQRTVNLGKQFFDRVYLVISREIFSEYYAVIEGCMTMQIGTGQGDAHSFLRAARLIKEDSNSETITLCWGDTFFLNNQPFRLASNVKVTDDEVGVSICSIDSEPYAWYEIDGKMIKKSFFRNKDGAIKSGMHDQSVFKFNARRIIAQLEMYMNYLGIIDDEDYIDTELSKEMKLLESFSYFYANKLPAMGYSLMSPGSSCSFNTVEELQRIRKKVEEVTIGDIGDV